MTTLRVTPPGEDGFQQANGLYQRAQDLAVPKDAPRDTAPPAVVDYLNMVALAEQQGAMFLDTHARAAWDRNYRSFHNQHFARSKYHSEEYRNRSKLFRPKTRAAVRKDNAATAAALFSTTDAVQCFPGNESDPNQRASAALVGEILNYRTDRTSGRDAIPWFRTAIGARQDAYVMGNCLTKQYWKLEMKKQVQHEPATNPDGSPIVDINKQPVMQRVEIYSPRIDRPDCLLIPLENMIIHPGADWLDPVQSSIYFIVKFPMTLDEVKVKQSDPRNPWKAVDEATLRSTVADSRMRAAATRTAREQGIDRMDNAMTGGGQFEIVWIYEVFIKIGGQDFCFYSAGSKAYLTEPKEVEEVYPEQGGERPYVLGTASLESHRILPMSPVEAFQPLQQEINDLANLRLDGVKQSVNPITFVKRGRQVDLGALRRRGPGTTILRTEKDDIEFAEQPEPQNAAYAEMDRLNADFDDLAGQFNAGTVQTNRSLNETVGGMNLIQGNANSVQEFDLRTWVETWAEPAVAQIVKCIQYYESDETVLTLCGERAQLLQKFGVSQINDQMLQNQITVRVDVGLGSSNPAQRLQKFAGALQILEPIWQNNPQVQSGAITPNIEEINTEVFGLAGYRDGGKRFVMKGKPQGPNPQQQALVEKVMSEAMKNKSTAKLNEARAQNEGLKTVHGIHKDRAQMVHQARMDRANLTRDLVNDHVSRQNADKDRAERADQAQFDRQQAMQDQDQDQDQGQSEDQANEAQEPNLLEQMISALKTPRARQFEFIRDQSGKITGAREMIAPQQGVAQ